MCIAKLSHEHIHVIRQGKKVLPEFLIPPSCLSQMTNPSLLPTGDQHSDSDNMAWVFVSEPYTKGSIQCIVLFRLSEFAQYFCETDP